MPNTMYCNRQSFNTELKTEYILIQHISSVINYAIWYKNTPSNNSTKGGFLTANFNVTDIKRRVVYRLFYTIPIYPAELSVWVSKLFSLVELGMNSKEFGLYNPTQFCLHQL